MDTDKSLLYVIPKLWKSWKIILGASLIAGILTAVIMLTKPDYYRSSSLFYPVNNALLSPIVDMKDQYQGYFGNDRDVDRLLSIGNSRSVADAIIEEYNLADHYHINTDTPKGRQKLYIAFKKLFNVHKTEFDAISLSIEDTDPVIAQSLAQAVLQKIDQEAAQFGINSQENIVNALEKDISQKTKQLELLSDSITNVRRNYGIYDTNVQAEALAELEVKSPGNATVQRKIQNYNSGIAELIKLEVAFEELSKSLVYHQIEYDKIKNNLGHGISVLHVIEEPNLPLAKSRPQRSLYVLGSMIFIGLIACLYVLLREQLIQEGTND